MCVSVNLDAWTAGRLTARVSLNRPSNFLLCVLLLLYHVLATFGGIQHQLVLDIDLRHGQIAGRLTALVSLNLSYNFLLALPF